MSVYGNYPPSRLTQIINDMDFSGQARADGKRPVANANKFTPGQTVIFAGVKSKA
jgi:hypothetical protein